MLMEDDFLITSATFSRFYEFATVPFLGQTLYNRSFPIVFNSPRGYSPRISENIPPRLIYDESENARSVFESGLENWKVVGRKEIKGKTFRKSWERVTGKAKSVRWRSFKKVTRPRSKSRSLKATLSTERKKLG